MSDDYVQEALARDHLAMTDPRASAPAKEVEGELRFRVATFDGCELRYEQYHYGKSDSELDIRAADTIASLRREVEEAKHLAQVRLRSHEEWVGKWSRTNEALRASEAALEAMRAALERIALLGEQGMKPDYNEWLAFHEKVAQVARAALSPAQSEKGVG